MDMQPHLLAGATLCTEDRGDICIRSADGHLLYRFVPRAGHESADLPEALRVAHANARAFKAVRNPGQAESQEYVTRHLLLDVKSMVRKLWAGFYALKQDAGATMEASLKDADLLMGRVDASSIDLDIPAKS